MKLSNVFLSLFVIIFGIAAVYCMIVYMPSGLRWSIVHIASVLFVAYLTIYAGVKLLCQEFNNKE